MYVRKTKVTPFIVVSNRPVLHNLSKVSYNLGPGRVALPHHARRRLQEEYPLRRAELQVLELRGVIVQNDPWMPDTNVVIAV